MVEVVVIGGGWSGCAAAVSVKKAGGRVTLLERTDMLLGTGLIGGIMRNNGRFTAAEEMIALGGGDLFQICDRTAKHTNVDFPGHQHALLYDVVRIHSMVLNHLTQLGVKIVFQARVRNVSMDGQTLLAVQDEQGREFHGDVFIDATGTAGPQANCTRYGNGCAMCILRCPSFGGRVSIAALAGVKETAAKKTKDRVGAMSGSCKLNKESLSEEIQQQLNEKGAAVIPVPEKWKEDHLSIKACQQYNLAPFKDNIVLLDTGHAKLMTPFFTLEGLRKIPGFENARYEDPYAGGKGNSMRFFAMAPRDNSLHVHGVDNLFCCGEKAGLLVGHTEAISTGTLAGHNSMRYALGMDLLELPSQLAVGDMIAQTKEVMDTGQGLNQQYTFSGSVYFDRMTKHGMYTTNVDDIRQRVERLGLTNIFQKKL
jgi:hypothetical protein